MRLFALILFVLFFSCRQYPVKKVETREEQKPQETRLVIVSDQRMLNTYVRILRDTKTGKEFIAIVGSNSVAICPIPAQ